MRKSSFLEERFLLSLAKCKQEHRYRRLVEGPLEGIDFCSNDYLGLAADEALQAETIQRWRKQPGNGATGSRLLSGNSAAVEALEEELADFFSAPAALFFPTGYVAVLATLSAVTKRGDLLLYDADMHASTKDAARLSPARRLNFKHNDIEALKKRCKKHPESQIFVISEGIFSMNGDPAPLQDLLDLCASEKATLMLDEAHSTGVFGPKGQGIAYDLGVHEQVSLRIHTFGKAFGAQGACLLGSRALMDHVINFSRCFIYSTAPLPVQVHALRAVLEHFRSGNAPISQLWKNISLFQQLAAQLLPKSICAPQSGPIQIFSLPNQAHTCKAARFLQLKGYDVRPILSPTVPVGKERIRVCLHSYNTPTEIQNLIENLSNYLKKSGLQELIPS